MIPTVLRDKVFDMLFKPRPVEVRLTFMPDGRLKRLLQKVEYNIDRVFIFFLLFIMLPGGFVIGLLASWESLKGFF